MNIQFSKDQLYQLLGLSFFMLLTACGKSFNSEAMGARGNLKVLILNNKVLNADTSPTEQEAFEFQVVELLNIYDLISLSGKFVQFYTKASNNEGSLKGTQPRGHFIKSQKGYFIAKDNFSMELAALYYHTQNLALLDNKIGVSEINKLPRKIVVDTTIKQNRFGDNNAIYDGEMDTIIYLSYTENNLPLALNGGVFAHEYFHSLFYKFIHKNLAKNTFFSESESPSETSHTLTLSVPKEQKIKFLSDKETAQKLKQVKQNPTSTLSKQNIKDYYEFLLKGFNEGIADYWGWSYTQDVNFIKHSIPEIKSERTLDLKAHQLSSPILYSKDDLLALVLQPFTSDSEKYEFINSFAYQVGTRFALFLKEFTSTMAKQRSLSLEEAKLNVMKALVQSLKQLGTNFTTYDFTKSNTEFLSSQDLIFEFAKNIELKSLPECELILTTYRSDIKNLNKLSCLQQNDNYVLTSVKEITNNQ